MLPAPDAACQLLRGVSEYSAGAHILHEDDLTSRSSIEVCELIIHPAFCLNAHN